MADSIGKASATFTADIQQFFAGTKAIRNEMAALKKDTSGGAGAINMGGIGHGLEAMLPGLAHLATAGGAVMFFRELVGHARELVVQAERLEIPIQRMQELAWFAEKAGKGVEALVAPMQKLERTIGEAFMDKAEAAKPFKEMQLSIGDLVAMDPAEQLEAVGKALLSIENPALRTALGMEVFGKSYKQIEPILRDMAKGAEAAIISRASITALSDFALLTKTAWHEIKEGASEVAGILLHSLFGLGENVKTQRELNEQAAREATIRRQTADVMKSRQLALDREVKAQKELAEFAEKAAKFSERLAGLKEIRPGDSRNEVEKERDRIIKEFLGSQQNPAQVGEAYRGLFPRGYVTAELDAIKAAKKEAADLTAELAKGPRHWTAEWSQASRFAHDQLATLAGPLISPTIKDYMQSQHEDNIREAGRRNEDELRLRRRMRERLESLQPILDPSREKALYEQGLAGVLEAVNKPASEASKAFAEMKASQDAAKESAKEFADAQRDVVSAITQGFTAEEKYAKAISDIEKYWRIGALGGTEAGARNRGRLEAQAKQELLDAWKREESQTKMPGANVLGTQEEYAARARYINEAREGKNQQARFNDLVTNKMDTLVKSVEELVRIGNATNKFEAPP